MGMWEKRNIYWQSIFNDAHILWDYTSSVIVIGDAILCVCARSVNVVGVRLNSIHILWECLNSVIVNGDVVLMTAIFMWMCM